MTVTSYNGWPASKDPKAIGINSAFEPLPGHKFPAGVKSGDVETVFAFLVTYFHEHIEPVDLPGPADEWGYFYKPSANSPKLISCHSSGTALDINATRHPNGKTGTFTKAQLASIAQLLAILTCVDWRGSKAEGGVASGTPDPMHWEIAEGPRGTPAQVARIASLIRGGHFTAQAVSPAVPFTSEEDDMTFIITNDHGVVLLHAGRLVHINSIPGIDQDQNQWDLRKDQPTWANLEKAYGPVVG